jgi:uncharacterized integral membrane protein
MSSGTPTSATPARAPRRKEQIRQLVAGAAVALVIVFAVLNTNKVSVDWIVVSSHTPLIVVIVVSFLLGAVGGALFWRRRAN